MRPKVLKARRVEELKELFKKYRVVALVDLHKSSADLIHLFRNKFRGKAVIKAAKKTLVIRASREAGRPAIAEFLEGHKSPVAAIFTDINPFTLKMELDKGKILTPPKPNERADIDVVIPPVNTGLQPGPILSEFGKMRIPTRIDGGTIWIARETAVAKKGDVIQPALASLLAKLEIGAVYRSINVLVMFDGDLMIPSELLSVDLEGTFKMISEAHSASVALATQIGYVTPETIVPLIVKAHLSAVGLSVATGYPVREIVGIILARAEAQAATLAKLVGTQSAS